MNQAKKRIAKFERAMIRTARAWKEKFFAGAPDKLAEAIWNRYGYQVAVNGEKVEIWARRQVIAEI